MRPTTLTPTTGVHGVARYSFTLVYGGYYEFVIIEDVVKHAYAKVRPPHPKEDRLAVALRGADAFHSAIQRIVGPSMRATRRDYTALEAAQIWDRHIFWQERLTSEVRNSRNEAIRSAVAEGNSMRYVAAQLGMTPQAVAKIVSATPSEVAAGLDWVDPDFL